MKHLKIAYSFDVQYYFVDSDREIVPVEQTDFTDVAVAVLSDQDFDYIDKLDETGFGIPIIVIMNPQEAQYAFIRNQGELVPLDEIEGRIALEGALPYPPGVLCVVPGERWSSTAVQYFQALEEGLNVLPGFASEIQGVYLEREEQKIRAYGYVLKKEFER